MSDFGSHAFFFEKKVRVKYMLAVNKLTLGRWRRNPHLLLPSEWLRVASLLISSPRWAWIAGAHCAGAIDSGQHIIERKRGITSVQNTWAHFLKHRTQGSLSIQLFYSISSRVLFACAKIRQQSPSFSSDAPVHSCLTSVQALTRTFDLPQKWLNVKKQHTFQELASLNRWISVNKP